MSGVMPQVDGDVPNTRRILICAPSNAAVDELVLRFKAGIYGSHGKKFEPAVVRLGRSDAVNGQVRDVTLEELVDRELEKRTAKSGEKNDNSLRERQQEVVRKRNELRSRLEARADITGEEYAKIDEEIRSLNKTIKELSRQLDLQREERIIMARNRDAQRRQVQDDILKNAQVICSTLSGSAHKVLTALKVRFDTVIIDEAAQCVELSALIPLRYGCTQCIMVGDPNQLPPTVLSQAASNLKYEQSLFVRMFDQHPERVHLLDTQFRMHPDIARFPSKEFYEGHLLSGDRMASITARPWHSNPNLSPYKFFDVAGSQRKATETKSSYNTEEAIFAYDLFLSLFEECKKQGDDDPALSVGIISPYKRQVAELKEVFRKKLGDAILDQVDFNTVDGFQGQEKDVIILSCVRAMADAKGVGFLGDTRRMNVAITRAKSSLWILGNERNLTKNPVWARLINDAKERKMFVNVRSGKEKKAEGNKKQKINDGRKRVDNVQKLINEANMEIDKPTVDEDIRVINTNIVTPTGTGSDRATPTGTANNNDLGSKKRRFDEGPEEEKDLKAMKKKERKKERRAAAAAAAAAGPSIGSAASPSIDSAARPSIDSAVGLPVTSAAGPSIASGAGPSIPSVTVSKPTATVTATLTNNNPIRDPRFRLYEESSPNPSVHSASSPGSSSGQDESFGTPRESPEPDTEIVIQSVTTEAPIQAPIQAPVQAPAQVPTQVPVQAPAQVPVQVPTQALAPTPVQALAHAPTQTPVQAPTQAPTQTPIQAPTQAPIQTPVQASSQTTQTPGQAPHPLYQKYPPANPRRHSSDRPQQPPPLHTSINPAVGYRPGDYHPPPRQQRYSPAGNSGYYPRQGRSRSRSPPPPGSGRRRSRSPFDGRRVDDRRVDDRRSPSPPGRHYKDADYRDAPSRRSDGGYYPPQGGHKPVNIFIPRARSKGGPPRPPQGQGRQQRPYPPR